MFFFYFRLLIFISIVAVSCPMGWKPYKTSCYHVSTEDESWIDAMVSIVFARCKNSTFPDTSVKCQLTEIHTSFTFLFGNRILHVLKSLYFPENVSVSWGVFSSYYGTGGKRFCCFCHATNTQ